VKCKSVCSCDDAWFFADGRLRVRRSHPCVAPNVLALFLRFLAAKLRLKNKSRLPCAVHCCRVDEEKGQRSCLRIGKCLEKIKRKNKKEVERKKSNNLSRKGFFVSPYPFSCSFSCSNLHGNVALIIRTVFSFASSTRFPHLLFCNSFPFLFFHLSPLLLSPLFRLFL